MKLYARHDKDENWQEFPSMAIKRKAARFQKIFIFMINKDSRRKQLIQAKNFGIPST